MPDAAIDACCLIDVLASGEADTILRAGGFTWHIPSAVQGEVRYRRGHDAAQRGKIVTVPVDLSGPDRLGLIGSMRSTESTGIGQVHSLRALFQSDGEAADVSGDRRTAPMDRGDRRPQGDSGRPASGPGGGELPRSWLESGRPRRGRIRQR